MLEALEEQLPAAARAHRLVGLIPGGGLTARRAVGGTKLLERGAPGARHEDLTEAMPTEVAVELCANSHENLHPKNGASRCLVPVHANGRSRSINWYALPRPAGSVAGEPGRGVGLGGLDLEGDQRVRVGQVPQLLDDAARDDVEVVVAVVLALVADVVVADHDDVLGRFLPEQAAGELPETVRLEVVRDRRT